MKLVALLQTTAYATAMQQCLHQMHQTPVQLPILDDIALTLFNVVKHLAIILWNFDVAEYGSQARSNIYYADESGLYWKLLPGKTYVSWAEKTVPGRKAEKQRITFMACTNASGRHKVKPLVIGKAKNPRPFRNVCLPVHYRHSKSAWMTGAIFKDWFHNLFVPEVQNFLKNNDLPLKALLILDNAPSHPPENQLQTSDGCITVIYMPPTVTPLIQPMDQNVIRLTKLFYRKSLLLSIIAAEKENICEAVKEITIKDAVFNLRSAWDSLDGAVIAKCWKNIFESNEHFDEEDDIPLSVLRQQDFKKISEEVINLLNHLNEGITHTPGDIGDWNEDKVLSDIEEAENENEEEDVQLVMERPTCSVSSKDAVILFDKIIEWAGHNNTDFSDIMVMKRLQEKAIQINLNLRKSQTKVTNYFPKM
ncbi:jerky protein homolog-like [Eupeodes corollae]|uniref:jerky protein homolog-like n=1 Tax=Eupeodes corollae TaxID=290404 RepID=UPI00249383F3|nr:jerky protein homolog-like [Eupeodes corollae]